MLWLRPARTCQVQSILPVLNLPELDWRLSAPKRTEQIDLGHIGFSAQRQAGPGQVRPLGVSGTTGSSILFTVIPALGQNGGSDPFDGHDRKDSAF